MPKKAIEEVKERDLGGRPTKWRESYNREAYELCLLGYTDKELAEHFGVSEATLNLWKEKDNGFLESLKEGKWKADTRAVGALRQRVEGMTTTETVVVKNGNGEITETRTVTKEIPPDTKAINYWLNNRQRDRWKNRTSLDPLDKDGQSISFKVDYGDNSTVQPKPNVETLPSGDTEGPETGKGFSNTASARKDKSSDG